LSLVRLLPAWVHAIADYAVALSLIVVALVVGGPGKAVTAGVVVGAVVLVVSLLTRYPLGVIKVLPFKVHSAGDYLAAALLVAAPFALGFTRSARGLTMFYIGAGVAVLLVSLVTNYQYSPKGQAFTATAKRGALKGAQGTQMDEPPPRTAPVPSYPPQGGPEPSNAPQTSQASPPSYASQAAAPPSYAPQTAAQPGPVDRSWRSASWQTRALADPRASTPAEAPRTPVQPAAVEPVTPEPRTPEPAPLATPSSVDEPMPASRPLREILAERAANQRSVA
jgi:hypothetical protein